jgi:U3 small nucleolar RNA-associated protein 21
MSSLFTPYKTCGVVCGSSAAQLCLQQLGEVTFLSVPVGRSFQVYNLQHLTLAIVSRELKHDITHISSFKEITFAATSFESDGIAVFDRSRILRSLTWEKQRRKQNQQYLTPSIVSLLVVGNTLLSLHESGHLRVWDITTAISEDAGVESQNALISTIDLSERSVPLKAPLGTTVPASPTTLLHPSTYVNKVAVGTSDGGVLIVNVRTGRILHECRISQAGSAVTCIAQSPVVDVVGIGLANGTVVVHNLRADATICTFSHIVDGSSRSLSSVSSIAFCSENALLGPVLASGSEDGAIALWDLNGKRLRHFLPSAHDLQTVSFLSFVPRQPCLVSAGADNALRIWSVDRLDGSLRLLRSRCGHIAPPRIIRYYGDSSVNELSSGSDARVCEIASAGADRTLRVFHTAIERQNREISQGKGLGARAKELGVHVSSLRLPQITAIALSDRRNAQWADVVTAHAGDSKAYLWSWDNKCIEDRVLVMPSHRESVTSVCITSCGHFALLGGSNGTLCAFSLESGGRRGTFPHDPSISSSISAKGKARRVGALHVNPGGRSNEGLEGPVDRDIGRFGRGYVAGSGNPMLGKTDSVDTTLAIAMGIAPPPTRAEAAASIASGKMVSRSVGSFVPSQRASSSDMTIDEALSPRSPSQRHLSAIYGIGTDLLNATAISADASGLVLFWDFATHSLRSSLVLPAPVSSLVLSRSSGLAALSCDDFSVRVIDVSTRRQVRCFSGHVNRITDICFSPEGRWLLSSSLDRTIRVWDLPTARCLDWLRFENVPVSIAFSPTSEYLITAHADCVGISMWANKAHFGGAVIEGVAPSTPYVMDLPRMSLDTNDGQIDEVIETDSLNNNNDTAEGTNDVMTSASKKVKSGNDVDSSETPLDTLSLEPKSGCSITLSGIPSSQWANIGRLDMILERNRPIEPIKKPEAAPFFLPTSGGLNPVFKRIDKSSNDNDDGEDEWVGPTSAVKDSSQGNSCSAAPATSLSSSNSRFVSTSGRSATSTLSSLLRKAEEARLVVEALSKKGTSKLSLSQTSSLKSADDELDLANLEISTHLAGLSPLSLDLEIRSLCLGLQDDADGIYLLGALLRYFLYELSRGRLLKRSGGCRRFDLTQAQLNLTLSVYGNLLYEVPSLRSLCQGVRDAQVDDARRLRDTLDKALGLISLALMT